MFSLPDIEKLSIDSKLQLFLLAVGAIIPGYLFIFIYSPEAFKILTFPKLTVLSLSITCPLLAIFGLPWAYIIFYRKSQEGILTTESKFANFFIINGSLHCMLIIYATCLYGYFKKVFYAETPSMYKGITLILFLAFVQSIYNLVIFFKERKRYLKSIKR